MKFTIELSFNEAVTELKYICQAPMSPVIEVVLRGRILPSQGLLTRPATAAGSCSFTPDIAETSSPSIRLWDIQRAQRLSA